MKFTLTALTLLFPILLFSQIEDMPVIEDDNPILLTADQMPVAPGCELIDPYSCTEQYIMDFLQENVSVADSIRQVIELRGHCLVRFVVNEKGETEDVVVLRSNIERSNQNPTEEQMQAIEAVKEAAVDAVRKLKFKEPARQYGEVVKVQEVVPVRFR